jgi:hypothetical protein
MQDDCCTRAAPLVVFICLPSAAWLLAGLDQLPALHRDFVRQSPLLSCDCLLAAAVAAHLARSATLSVAFVLAGSFAVVNLEEWVHLKHGGTVICHALEASSSSIQNETRLMVARDHAPAQ